MIITVDLFKWLLACLFSLFFFFKFFLIFSYFHIFVWLIQTNKKKREERIIVSFANKDNEFETDITYPKSLFLPPSLKKKKKKNEESCLFFMLLILLDKLQIFSFFSNNINKNDSKNSDYLCSNSKPKQRQ